MRYRSKILSSSFPDLPWVSYCQVIIANESLGIKDLRANLDALLLDQDRSEFLVLIDEKSPQVDGLRAEFVEQLESGFLKVVLYSEEVPASRLKNLAFGLAKGNVVMSLTVADQLAPRMTTYTHNEMMHEQERVLVYDKRGRVAQRVAVSRSMFYEIGGFDERLPAEKQVINLIDRLKNIGVSVEVKPHDHLTKSRTKRKRAFDFFRTKSLENVEFQRPKESEYKWLT